MSKKLLAAVLLAIIPALTAYGEDFRPRYASNVRTRIAEIRLKAELSKFEKLTQTIIDAEVQALYLADDVEKEGTKEERSRIERRLTKLYKAAEQAEKNMFSLAEELDDLNKKALVNSDAIRNTAHIATRSSSNTTPSNP